MFNFSSFSPQKILKNSFWIYLFSYIGAPLGYLTRMLISRDTSVEELGFLYSLIGFIGLLSAYNGLGLTESLKYFIPKYLAENKLDHIKTALIWSVIAQVLMGMVIIAGLYFGADYLALHYFKNPDISYFLKLACWYFLGTNSIQILMAIFLGFQDTFSSKLMELVQVAVTLLFTIGIFTLQKWEVLTYAAGWFLGLMMAVGVWLFIYFKKYHSLISQAKRAPKSWFFKTFFHYSFWTFLSMNSGILLWAIDQQMILSLAGWKEAGLYANYLSLIGIFSIGIMPLVIMLVPTFTALLAQGERERLELFKTKLYSYISVFSISLSVLLFVLAPQLATLLYGDVYLASWLLLRVSVFFYTFNVLATINFTLLSALGKVRAKTLLTIGVWLLNIFLNYFLIQRFASMGSLYSTILGWGLLAGVSFYFLGSERPRLDWKFMLKNMLYCLCLGGGMWMLLWRSESYQIENFWLKLGVIFGLVGLYYVAMIWGNRSEVKSAFRLLVQKK